MESDLSKHPAASSVEATPCEEEIFIDDGISVDIYNVLRERELDLPKYRSTSPQLCYRRCLVDWLSLVSKKLKLSNGVLHMAVKYMDLVMDKFEFSKEPQLTLLAVCSLWIAAKLDEKDDAIPSLASLREIVQNNYESDDFLQMELIVMQSLDWRLLLPTAEQFTGYYIDNCLCASDLHVGFKITNFDKAYMYIKKYVSYFLEVSLQDYTFYHFLPSQVAASVLFASRTCIKISPAWSRGLVSKTGYTYSDLECCVQKLMAVHAADELKANSSIK